ncbi:MAG: transglutaminase domain-containing protein [Candidatus ainarchaeum sp.]|nr:transglutaminase domain-containing protein [Candidatus ainarchaeum sp.]
MPNPERLPATALLLALFAAISFAQAGNATASPDEWPVHLPYDEIGGYDYPNLNYAPGYADANQSQGGPPGQEGGNLSNQSGRPGGEAPSPQPSPEWIQWWQQFDGSDRQPQEDRQDDPQNPQPDQGAPKPTAYVVWVVSPSEPGVYWKDKTYDVYSGWDWRTSGNGSYSAAHGEKGVEFQVFRVLNGGSNSIQLIRPGTSGSFIRPESFRLISGSANYTLENDSYADTLLEINATEGASFTYNATFYPADYVDEASVGSASQIPAEIMRGNLRLPDSIDPQLEELARNLTDPGLSLLGQAEKDRDWVHAWLEYDLFWAANQTIPGGTEMANWTYSRRKGICAHYATLYTVIARLQGIPTRVAAGFAGGYPSGNSSYVFPTFAHAWAESFIPPYGWIPVDPTGNITEREKQDGSGEKENVSLEWSDSGKVTIDLRFTLNKTFQEEVRDEYRRMIEQEMRRNGTLDGSPEMTPDEMRRIEDQIERLTEERLQEFRDFLEKLSQENLTLPGNLSKLNWSDGGNASLNRSWNASRPSPAPSPSPAPAWNASLPANASNPYLHDLNRNWSWPANLTRRGNWSQFTRTWNSSRTRDPLLAPNPGIPRNNSAQRLRDSMRNGSPNGVALQDAAQGIISSAMGLGAIAAAVAAAAAAAAALLFAGRKLGQGRGSPAENAKALREMFRRVDIGKVVREYGRLGSEGRLDDAVVYAYNELADFIAFASRVMNDPSNTAREFQSSLAGRAVDMESLAAITRIFEKTRYAGKTVKADYDEFREALSRLAENGEKT